MSANRPAGAAGEDSDEYSEATDDQKRDEERAQRKQRQRARYKKEWPHSFRVLRPINEAERQHKPFRSRSSSIISVARAHLEHN